MKSPPPNAGDRRDVGLILGIPCSRKWQPTPVFLPERSHGQRAWWATVHGVAELDTTEHINAVGFVVFFYETLTNNQVKCFELFLDESGEPHYRF